MATVPTTPRTFTQQGVNGLTAKAYNKRLNEESVLGSVWDKLQGMVTVDALNKNLDSIPENIIFMKIETKLQGEIPNSIQLGMERPYNEAPRLGSAEAMLGQEENRRWKELTVYYNEIKKSFKFFGWGINANDQDFYGKVMKKVSPGAIKYFAELRDQRIHEALILTKEKALTKTPVSASQQFNPNIFIPNTDLGNMPSYDADATTVSGAGTYPFSDSMIGDYPEHIGDRLYAATNSGANPAYAYLNVESLLALDYHCAQTLKMPTINIGGTNCRILVLPSSQATRLCNPANTGSLGALWQEVANLNTEIQSLPGIMGKVRELLIVENQRFPTITLGGSDGSWTLQPGYMYPGNNDGRNSTTWSNTSGDLNYVFDVGYVLGPNAMVEWVANPLQYNLKETTEYGQIQGQGAYTNAGIQLCVYDEDTETDTSYYQNSSCLVLMTKPQLVTVT